jgi:hypothetical protein
MFDVTVYVRDLRNASAPPASISQRVQAPHHAAALEAVYRANTGAGYVVCGQATVAEATEDASPAPTAGGKKK